MTQDRQPDPFSELRGLMAEATPGPWKVAATADSLILSGRQKIAGTYPVGPDHYGSANANLIAAMRQALPALLDERDRLIGENERLRLIATDAALLGQVVASSYTPDHKPHTLKNPKTGDVVTGPIADAVIELVKIIIEQGNTARQALSQEIG